MNDAPLLLHSAAIEAISRGTRADRLLVVADVEGVLVPADPPTLPGLPEPVAAELLSLATAPGTVLAFWSARPDAEVVSAVGEPLAAAALLIGPDHPRRADGAADAQMLLDHLEAGLGDDARNRYRILRTERTLTLRFPADPPDAIASLLASLYRWAAARPDVSLCVGRDELRVGVGVRSKGDAVEAILRSHRPDVTVVVSDEMSLDDTVHHLGPVDACVVVGPGLTRLARVADAAGARELLSWLAAARRASERRSPHATSER